MITYGYSLSKYASLSAAAAAAVAAVRASPIAINHRLFAFSSVVRFPVFPFSLIPCLGGSCGNASCSDRLRLWVDKPDDDSPALAASPVSSSGGDTPDPDVC